MKLEERLNKIDNIISRVNEAMTVTKNKWDAMASNIPSAKTLDKEILPQVVESLSSLSSIDTAIKRNHYYGRLLSLTTKKSETINEDVVEKLEIWKYIANIARNIVESMYKTEMFDGFGDDDLFKKMESSVNRFCKLLFDDPSQLICEYLQKTWLEDSINIGLFGKYSSGKTTILNCLYGENFPTNNAENTAVPTYLYHGNDTNNLLLVDVKGRSIKICEEEVAILDTNLSESFPFYQLYEYIAKQNPSVPENYTIIDAPGVMGKNSNEPVINALKQCDIIVWLLDIRGSLSGGMKESDIEFIKNNVSKPLFVVLTYTDRLDQNNYNQALSVISDEFKKAGVDVKGYMRYNKLEEDRFKQEFNATINEGISQFEIKPQNPYLYIRLGVSYLRNILKNNEVYYTELRNKANSEVDKYYNCVVDDYNRLNDKFGAMIRKTNDLIDHFNSDWNRFAGNGYKVRISSLTDSIDNLTSAWRDSDIINNVTGYAENSRKKQDAVYKLQMIEKLKKDFENSIGQLYKE